MLNSKKLLITLFLFLLTLSTVQAISLNVIKKSDYIEINPGETEKLTVLFWNTKKTTEIKLRLKKAPNDLNIIIKPDNFILNKSKPESPPFDENAEYLNLPGGIIKTYPVDVYINIPKSTELGIYEVSISTNTVNPSRGISVSLERTLDFTVIVTERVEEGLPGFLGLSKDTMDKLTGMASAVTEQGNILLIFVLTVTVIGVSWIIKRGL